MSNGMAMSGALAINQTRPHLHPTFNVNDQISDVAAHDDRQATIPGPDATVAATDPYSWAGVAVGYFLA